MRKRYLLRTVSRVSACLVGVHAALLAIYYSVGPFFFLGSSGSYLFMGKLLLYSSAVTMAVFGLSIQLAMLARNRDQHSSM